MSEAISNRQWLEARVAAVPRGVATATPVFAARARNAQIWDVEGRRYIDFASGIGVLATGHCHPRVVEAVTAQMQCFTHTAFQVMAYEPYVRLAERLNALAPFAEAAQTLLVTTGAEAVENAVKIARLATGRSGVVAFSGAFHGRTQLTMALTGKVTPYKKGMGPLGADVFRVPFPVPHLDVTVRDCMGALESLFYADAEPGRIAAIIVEPVQGEGGFQVAPRELLQALRALCDQHGIMLIADEVQTGFGRTGRMFAIEHSGVEPDLVAVAKSLAGGFPLAGVIGRRQVMDRIDPGGLGGTYGGSPVGCAAALAVLDVIRDEGLIERAQALGQRLRSRLERWSAGGVRMPVRNVRGLGAMLAFDLPDAASARRVTAAALGRGLIVLACGRNAESIRLLMPLTIEDEVLEEGMAMLEAALGEAAP